MSSFRCSLRIPEAPGLDAEALTVGRVFLIDCEGKPPAFAEGKPLSFKYGGSTEAEQAASKKLSPYALKYLGWEGSTADRFSVQATSYVVGRTELPKVLLTDGSLEADLGPVRFEVISVIDKEQAQPEPYGPLGPLSLPFPTVYVVVPLALLAFVAALGFRAWRRRRQRASLLEKMREYEVSLPPLADFHSQMRRLRRREGLDTDKELSTETNRSILAEIDKAFRIFLIRRFQWPALDWSESALMAAFKKERRKLYDAAAVDLRRLRREIDAGLKTSVLSSKDVLKILEFARQVAEKLDADRADRPERKA